MTPVDAGGDVSLTEDGSREAAVAYAGDRSLTDPLVSPLHGDLDGMPPLLAQVGDADLLLDDSVRFVEQAKAAGVDATLEVWPEMPHVFQAFAGFLPDADEAIERIGVWVRSALSEGSGA